MFESEKRFLSQVVKSTSFRLTAATMLTGVALTACSEKSPVTTPTPPPSETPTPVLQLSPTLEMIKTRPTSRALPTSVIMRTKTEHCVVQNGRPDSGCSPGDALPGVTEKDVCVHGYASRVRDVSEAVKNAVYAEYDILEHYEGQFEIDHIISLELGGSNDIANLFPQAAEPRPGYHEKDTVEDYLHDQVCNHGMPLVVAQAKISGNWYEVYVQLPTPTPRPAPRSTPRPTRTPVAVMERAVI